jgi:hypothetical protein
VPEGTITFQEPFVTKEYDESEFAITFHFPVNIEVNH